MNVGLLVATYGSYDWKLRGIRTTRELSHYLRREIGVHGAQLIPFHGLTLAHARNTGIAALYAAGCDWFVVVDADDQIETGYIDAIAAAAPALEPALLQPAVRTVVDGDLTQAPVMFKPVGERGLLLGNHLVIGTAFHWESFTTVGGFQDLPVLEDWDFFAGAWAHGADVIEVPDAVYQYHVSEGSRNGSLSDAEANRVAIGIRERWRPIAAMNRPPVRRT